MNDVNELGLTDNDFVDQYIEKAKTSIEAADEWVKELNNGEVPSPEFVSRLAPEVIRRMAAEGLIPQVASGEAQAPTPSEGITEDTNASPEAVQELSEASTEE